MIRDNIIDFWFKFVFKNREMIEYGNYVPEKKVMAEYFGKKFERFVRREVIHRFGKYDVAGRWWYKNEEIDVVAINEKKSEITFIECKWKKLGKRDVKRIINELQRKVEYIPWNKENRTERFGVFGKKIPDKDQLRQSGFLVYDLEDIRRTHFGTGS